MPITIPAADSSDQIDDTDLLIALRPGDAADAAANFGVRAQSFAHLMPEHRFLSTTLTATTGTDATWAISWDSGPLANPRPVRLDWYSRWRQTGFGADADWSIHTWGAVFIPTVGNTRGGWFQVHVAGSGDDTRVGHTTRTTDGDIRVGSTILDGANGWNMDYHTGTSTLRLDQRGTPPHGSYSVVALVGAVTV